MPRSKCLIESVCVWFVCEVITQDKLKKVVGYRLDNADKWFYVKVINFRRTLFSIGMLVSMLVVILVVGQCAG